MRAIITARRKSITQTRKEKALTAENTEDAEQRFNSFFLAFLATWRFKYLFFLHFAWNRWFVALLPLLP
jgi:hypothetical protein